MPLIKDNEFVEDTWKHLEDADPLPETGTVIISFARLKKEADRLKNKKLKLGVTFPNTADPKALEPYLPALDLITLEFPTFADGRAYSLAHALRKHLGYNNELRATGDVLPDQAMLMIRCGFDAFEVSEEVSLEVWRRCVGVFGLG